MESKLLNAFVIFDVYKYFNSLKSNDLVHLPDAQLSLDP